MRDGLLGRLLRNLFPRTIKAEEVFSYLHRRKNDLRVGSYYMFWSHIISEAATDRDVPVLLDALTAKKPALDNHMDLSVRNMIGKLLNRGVRGEGEDIPDQHLYQWISLAVDKHGSRCIEQKESMAIDGWLEAHPDRYKGLLSAGIAACGCDQDFQWFVGWGVSLLVNVKPPDDLGLWWLSKSESEPNQRKADYLFGMAVDHFFRGQAAMGLSLEFFEEWVQTKPRFKPAYQRAFVTEIPDWRQKRTDRERNDKAEQKKRRDEWMQYFRRHLPKIQTGEAPPKVLHILASAYFGLLIEVHGKTELECLSNFLDNDTDLISAALNGFRCSLERPDLPTVHEILKSNIRGRQHYILQSCLAGMTEHYRKDPSFQLGLSDETLSKIVAFQYTYPGEEPDWFIALLEARPAVVAHVLIEYTTMLLKAKKNLISGIYSLAHSKEYASVTRLAIVPLLNVYPIRATKKQASSVLGNLLNAALRYLNDDEMKQLVDERLAISTMDAAQRVYWLAAGLVIAPRHYEVALTAFVGKRRARIQTLASFFGDRFNGWVIRDATKESSLAYLVRMLAPICSPARPQSVHAITPAMHTADFVHSLISRLEATPTPAAEEEIKELLNDPSLSAWHRSLRHALHNQQVSYRETTFSHPTVAQVCETLERLRPANAADLAALVSDCLRELASEIRNGNTDQYKQFWNVDSYARPTGARPEDACRDTLLERLKDRLRPLGIEALPEGHYADNKRADIRISYTTPQTSMAIPIEVKRDSHPDLWTAMTDQLIALYTREPEAKGRGIFLAFWFGGKGMPTPPTGSRPTSAEELEAQLLAIRPPDKRELISVCVVDCALSIIK